MERSEPPQDFDMDIAKRLVLAEAKRTFPGGSRRFDICPRYMAWIRGALGRVFLQYYKVVELAPDSGRKFPIIIAEGTEEGEWIYRELSRLLSLLDSTPVLGYLLSTVS